MMKPGLAAHGDLVRHCPACLAIYRSEFTRCPVDGEHIVTSDSDPMLGVTVAEHYQIDELIGIGSSGRVYLAHHRRLSQRRFALKILFGDLAATSSARMRFTHEAESASRLAHPNLVSVVDFGKTPAGLLYLAMDYIEGPTLASLIERNGAMAQDRAVRMGIQLSRGLAHAHDLGLIHRDFKPDNILVSSDAHGDVPRIVDFGIALSSDDGDPRLTATGVTLGTPAYAAPEQTTDGEVDHRADLFALGVTMYELLTGVLPFEGTVVEIMRQNATMDPPPMAERAPGVQVTSALQHVVFKLMARDPAQRYQTAREVLEALTELPRRVSVAPSRPSSTVIPSLLPVSSSTADRAGARTTAMSARQGTPPSMTASGAAVATPPAGMAGVRPSSPRISRQSSPAMGVFGGVRPSSPALGATGPARPSTPLITVGSGPTRASTPVIGPLAIPSSTQLHAASASAAASAASAAEVPEVVSRDVTSRHRGELPPLITPVARRRFGAWTLVLAMVVAAVLSMIAVVAYQRISGSRGAAKGAASSAEPAVAPAPAPTPAAAASPDRTAPAPLAPAPAAAPVEAPVVPGGVVDEPRPGEGSASAVTPAREQDDTVVGAPGATRRESPRRRRSRSTRSGAPSTL